MGYRRRPIGNRAHRFPPRCLLQRERESRGRRGKADASARSRESRGRRGEADRERPKSVRSFCVGFPAQMRPNAEEADRILLRCVCRFYVGVRLRYEYKADLLSNFSEIVSFTHVWQGLLTGVCILVWWESFKDGERICRLMSGITDSRAFFSALYKYASIFDTFLTFQRDNLIFQWLNVFGLKPKDLEKWNTWKSMQTNN